MQVGGAGCKLSVGYLSYSPWARVVKLRAGSSQWITLNHCPGELGNSLYKLHLMRSGGERGGGGVIVAGGGVILTLSSKREIEIE